MAKKKLNDEASAGAQAPAGLPEWFVWTTTLGLALVLLMLYVNYSALSNLSRAQYGMMQGTSDMNMMNSGMMRMMAGAMMRSGAMTQQEYDALNQAYGVNADIRQRMGGMMSDGAVSDGEYRGMMDGSQVVQGMMQGGMMGR